MEKINELIKESNRLERKKMELNVREKIIEAKSGGLPITEELFMGILKIASEFGE